MKVAMIGSREYENTRKIKDALFKLKQKFGDALIVISGGAQYGADKFVRKFALEFGIKYKEFNPAHTTKNLYSAMSDNYYLCSTLLLILLLLWADRPVVRNLILI